MIVTAENYKGYCTGSKAERLFQMKQHGLNVPDLFCALPETQKEELLSYARSSFRKGTLFSVRSSASRRASPPAGQIACAALAGRGARRPSRPGRDDHLARPAARFAAKHGELSHGGYRCYGRASQKC